MNIIQKFLIHKSLCLNPDIHKINHFEYIEKQNLPKDQFIIFGSAVLAMYGIRKNHDIDMMVTKKLYDKMIKKYKPEEKTARHTGDKYFRHKCLHVFTHDMFFGDMFDPENKKRLMEVNGFKFYSVQTMIEWKRNFHRIKDMKDVDKTEEDGLAKRMMFAFKF